MRGSLVISVRVVSKFVTLQQNTSREGYSTVGHLNPGSSFLRLDRDVLPSMYYFCGVTNLRSPRTKQILPFVCLANYFEFGRK